MAGYNIVLGICGGIAAYKACDLTSRLIKYGFNVDVLMTKNATEFITPLTFQSLSANKVTVDTFEKVDKWEIGHISLAKKADCFVIVPATANVLGKLAQGIADDMLTTTVMATKAPILIAPAMNTNMYLSDSFQTNLKTLIKRGYRLIEPDTGRLACGDTGVGKLASVDTIFDTIVDTVMPKSDLLGKKVLISCGATIEPIDPIRYISNRSSGKMGFALAEAAISRGAIVTVVCGKISVPVPQKIHQLIEVETTVDMLNAIEPIANDFDYVVMAAAPADYTLKKPLNEKYKGESLTLELVKTPDISQIIGDNKQNFKLINFAAETKNLKNYAVDKMLKKHSDMIVANDVSREGAGFNIDTNIVTICTLDGKCEELPIMSKRKVADEIFDRIGKL